MITNEIVFHAPRSLDEALELLASDGDDITVLGGGMSLVPMMNLGIARPDIVMSLNHIAGIDRIDPAGECLTIGAGVRHARVARDPLIRRHCPLLADAAGAIGDVQVRNRGTIGGSVAHADPAADYLPVLAAVGATILLRSRGRERVVSCDEFFVDVMLTAREPTELVTAVSVPKLPGGAGYRRLARVEGSFPIVCAAAVVAGDRSGATLALGGIGPRPVTLDLTEHMEGVADEDAVLTAVGDAAYDASAGAVGDIMSDAEYRREMARVFARRALRAAFDAVEAGRA